MVFGHQYVLGSPLPWYPFGYGRSYSRFEYGTVFLDREVYSRGDTVMVSVEVRNVDDREERDGTEVMQVYVVDEVSSVVVPNRRLRGFEKVVVPAGETRRVRIPVRVGDLGLWDTRMQYVVEEGSFQVLVGSSSEDIRANATFYVR